jgi:Type IV pilin-like G and H, putative
MLFFTLTPALVLTSILNGQTLSNHFYHWPETTQDNIFLSRRPPKNINTVIENQVKAQKTIARLNRSQVAERLAGQNLKFTDNFDLLKVDPLKGKGSAVSGLYRYQIETDGENFTRQIATPLRQGMKSYVGMVHSRTTPGGGNISASILCESKKPTKKILPAGLTPLDSGGVPTCPANYIEVNY